MLKKILNIVFLICKIFLILAILITLCEGKYLKTSVNKYYLVALQNDADLNAAIALGRDTHFRLVQQIPGFKNIFLFSKIIFDSSNGNEKRSERFKLETDNRVLWASQQEIVKRDKRDFLFYPVDVDENYFETEKDYNIINSIQPLFNDELWDHQWYMKTRNESKPQKNLSLNVLPVYQKGYTGRGVRVAVLDDGIEYDHEDLRKNYDPDISWDCNFNRPDAYPNSKDYRNHHGTRCAGEIAMTANNKKCGVGIAFNVNIGGIKLLGGDVYDYIEGMALGFKRDKIDVYTASWGPTDDGKTLDKPGILASRALKMGVTEGRNGLGSIFVWASGNGRKSGDNCNCDGYATSIYTITIGSISQTVSQPWYSEECASIMTVTYSSGLNNDQMITTTDVGNTCTIKHTGTSASAPLAAGIIALGLEANPQLTWRDVQHLIVQSANYNVLKSNAGWQLNAAGLHYSTKFGFGLMDADAFVTIAERWKTVPPKFIEKIQGYNKPYNEPKTLNVNFEYKKLEINYLEHVEVTVNVACRRRGSLTIYLESPNQTRVQLLDQRIRDRSADCFNNWTFMSVATWSENPFGNWTLQLIDNYSKSNENDLQVGNCLLQLHGITY